MRFPCVKLCLMRPHFQAFVTRPPVPGVGAFIPHAAEGIQRAAGLRRGERSVSRVWTLPPGQIRVTGTLPCGARKASARGPAPGTPQGTCTWSLPSVRCVRSCPYRKHPSPTGSEPLLQCVLIPTVST